MDVRTRYVNSNMESLDGPYNMSLSKLHGGLHAKNKNSQDRFSLDRLNKNDPLATLDALKSKDYQLQKALELSIHNKAIP